MADITRRELLLAGLAAGCGLVQGADGLKPEADLHQRVLRLASAQNGRRKRRFAAVRSPSQLASLQHQLRSDFVALLGGLPETASAPAARKLGRLVADDYVIDKLLFESFPGYWVPALLYRPMTASSPASAVLSPCGHSTVGKAADIYQTFHINLVKRGHFVLTYDPVGQAERSQFWDAARGRSRFNLTCGEHCVLGNPLYLLGTSLAKYRVWDGMRGLDYLASLPEIDAQRIGCAGNSGGGTLTAYLAALDGRVRAALIGCYITALPHRMANRIQADPDSDPEQDIFDFVGRGIDHAGLLALIAPRPALVCSAQYDFFPIEGTRQTFAEAQHLYRVAGAEDRIRKVETQAKHGLSQPLREAGYAWFARWLQGKPAAMDAPEIEVTPRKPKDLQVCPGGQVNLGLSSRPLLPLAWNQFQRKQAANKPKLAGRDALRSLLRLDPESARFDLRTVTETRGDQRRLVLCVNGVESTDWQLEKKLLEALTRHAAAVAVLDPRGVGRLRPDLQIPNHDYADPLHGVEENIAYNAMLVGRTVTGMRVADLLAAIDQLTAQPKAASITLCARRDAALVACFAAALDPRVGHVAVEDMTLSFIPLFGSAGQAINASNLVPCLLRDFGDIPEVLRQIAPRRVLVAAARNASVSLPKNIQISGPRFTDAPDILTRWLWP